MTAELAQAREDVARLRGTRQDGTWPDGNPRYLDGELTQAIQDDVEGPLNERLARSGRVRWAARAG